MTTGRFLALAAFLTMTAALAWGFTTGHFWKEGAVLMDMPWGVISIIDVYTGAALFSGWIAYRERSVPRTLAWVALIFVMGNWATTLYALLAFRSARGDATTFWMGRRA